MPYLVQKFNGQLHKLQGLLKISAVMAHQRYILKLIITHPKNATFHVFAGMTLTFELITFIYRLK